MEPRLNMQGRTNH